MVAHLLFFVYQSYGVLLGVIDPAKIKFVCQSLFVNILQKTRA